jgi:hypothetical protein
MRALSRKCEKCLASLICVSGMKAVVYECMLCGRLHGAVRISKKEEWEGDIPGGLPGNLNPGVSLALRRCVSAKRGNYKQQKKRALRFRLVYNPCARCTLDQR